jgi:hypothetical protein
MSPKMGMEDGGRNDFVLGLVSVRFQNELIKKQALHVIFSDYLQ